MKSDLAEELLNHLMRWDRAEFQEKVRCLLALATYKFDEYGNFRPGDKFFESLAAWLDQLEPDERAGALDFVLERLIFISDAEMNHLIELVYPDHIELVLRDRVAASLSCSAYEVARIVKDPAFAALRRRSLVLGASDGARLDRLRRAAPGLSHEQFLQSDEPPVLRVAAMRKKLGKALSKLKLEAADTFAHVFLVDDFAGSGTTMLRYEDEEQAWAGKLTKLADALDRLKEEGHVEADVEVTVILYVASAKAERHLNDALQASPLPAWEVRVVQPLPDWLRVDRQDPVMTALSERYYDPALDDEIKGNLLQVPWVVSPAG